jgi:hypothetical protein
MRSDGEHGAADDWGGTKNVVHDKPKQTPGIMPPPVQAMDSLGNGNTMSRISFLLTNLIVHHYHRRLMPPTTARHAYHISPDALRITRSDDCRNGPAYWDIILGNVPLRRIPGPPFMLISHHTPRGE